MNDDPSPPSLDLQKRSSLPVVGCVSVVVLTLVAAGLGMFVVVPAIVAQRQDSLRHMYDVAIALHNYHDTYLCFPMAHFDKEDGKPYRSWRTALLPFIEEKALYDQYDHNAMWDSRKNRALSQETPTFFRSSFCDCSDGKTPFMVIVGENTLFPNEGNRGFRDAIDGTANSILFIADYQNPVRWNEPVDITLDELLARYADKSDIQLHVALASAELVVIREISADNLKKLAEVNDRQITPNDLWESLGKPRR